MLCGPYQVGRAAQDFPKSIGRTLHRDNCVGEDHRLVATFLLTAPRFVQGSLGFLIWHQRRRAQRGCTTADAPARPVDVASDRRVRLLLLPIKWWIAQLQVAHLLDMAIVFGEQPAFIPAVQSA
jgi:hypothetical protein